MPQPPLILYISAASEAGPVLIGVARRSSISGARLWVIVWCLLLVCMNVLGRYLGAHHVNNHFIVYITIPIQGTTILWALSLWQTRPMARLTVRAAIPPFIVAWMLLLLVEDMSNFSAVAEPVYSLLALGTVLFTLFMRSIEASDSLLRLDWFWICCGLALHFGALAILLPLAAAFVRTNVDIVTRAYVVRAAINILAFLSISCGILCPPSIPSGHSS